MSKKHKKHHKSERGEKSGQEEKPLKLVLKVGGASASDTPESIISEHSSERKHKHKKKKKKNKSSDKERDRDRHHKHDKHHHRERGGDVSIVETSEDVKEQTVEVVAPKTEEKAPAEKIVKETTEKKERTSKKRELEKDEKAETDLASREPPAKKALFGEEQELVQLPRTPRTKEEKSVLQKSLDYLHNILQRKDVNAFFSYPVTDSIAPGYSSIIKESMDFSTMKNKIDHGEYDSIVEYRRDFNLMCTNCMVYNQPETIFYKEAARLRGIGAKQLSKEKLIQMRKNLPHMSNLSDEELGLDQEEPIDVEGIDDVGATGGSTPVRYTRNDVPLAKSTAKFEAIMDDMSPEEILAQAQAAAREAAVELTMRKPNSKFGFLRRRKDGSTTFNILNPDNDGIVSEKERIVNLGQLTGKLTSGAGTLAGFREDKRNKAAPVNYMNYGPFSSYAPTYDSSFATLSKEDSDLLLSTYGDETGIQYAKSLKDFVSDAGEFATRIVDGLLNILTGHEHSKANKIFEEKRQEETEKRKKEKEEFEAKHGEKEAEDQENKVKEEEPTIDINSLKSLSDIGIDMSFLDNYDKQDNESGEIKTEEEKKIDEQLQNSAKLIGDLQKTQHERLSMKLPPHLAMVPGPSDAEKELASKVTTELTNLAKQVNPGEVTSVKAIRKAMGITFDPVKVEVEEGEKVETGDTEPDNKEETEQSSLANASQTEEGVVEDAPEPMMETHSPADETDLEGLMESPPSQEDDQAAEQLQTDGPDDSSQEEMDTNDS